MQHKEINMEKEVKKKADWADIEENASGGKGSVPDLEGFICTFNYRPDTDRHCHAVFNPFGIS